MYGVWTVLTPSVKFHGQGRKAPGSTDGRHGALRPCQVQPTVLKYPAVGTSVRSTEGVYAASGLLMHRQADPGILHHLLRTYAEPAHGHLGSKRRLMEALLFPRYSLDEQKDT